MEQPGNQNNFLLKSIPDREHLLDHIFENLKQSIVIVDKNLEILFLNQMAKENLLELIGKHVDFGQNLWDYIPNKSQDAVKHYLKKIYAGEKVNITIKFKNLTGKLQWFDNTICPLVNKGEEVEYIIINCMDITHQKATEKSIRESETKYKAIVQSQSDMICKFKPEGTITFVNNAYCRFFNISENNTIGADFYNLIPEYIREEAKSNIISLSPLKPLLNYFEEISGAEGHKRWISGTHTAFFDNDGIITEIQMVGKDITEQKEIQDDLIKALEKAEESDRIKSVFLANMSHEVRTPLNGILGFAGLLKTSIPDKDKFIDYCNIIEESGNRLLNIMDDILEISLIETNQLSLKNSNIYLPQIINNLYEYLKETLKDNNKKSIKIKSSIPVDGPNFFTIDGIRLYQVFMKLLNNALKFTHSGLIEYGYYKMNSNAIRFFVRDTGIGIPKEKHNIIFKRFRQADESPTRRYGGTGLGLAIAKALVDNMGGKLSVESTVNNGSNFYFDLPVPKKEEKVKIHTPATKTETLYNWDGKKFLIVEDNNINFILLREFLRRTKAVIIPAYTGNVALTAIEKSPDIDLILLDIRLPDISGYEIARRVKKTNPTIPIIAQTAYSTATDRLEALKAGCDAYLVKPIDRTDLLETISIFIKS